MPQTKIDDLVQAIRRGDKTTVERLLHENPELRRASLPGAATPILLALYCGRADVAALFVSYGATLDLFEACALGNIEQVRRCVESAPDWVNSFASDGYFPLGLAAFFGHAEIVRLLLTRGADVNLAAQNSTRVTALHGSVTRGAVDIVQVLLEHGANPNARQEGGFAPLHSAAAAGHEGIVRLLVEHGAEISPRSDQGKTPRDFAVERGKPEVAEWLKRRESGEE
jgi:ankyrin repeat protein